MSYLTTFTNLTQEFIEKLSDLYPEDKYFTHFKTYLLILKKTNPRKIVELFDKHCLQYRTYIKDKDAVFLLTNDFIKDNTKVNSDNSDNSDNIIGDEDVFNIMLKLRFYWEKMDTETTENVWKYLNLFLLLSDRLHSS